MKRDAPVKKPPLGAVPFSDEWLTAIEAAGEVLWILLETIENTFYIYGCQTNHCCLASP